jgi:hypothetical protein
VVPILLVTGCDINRYHHHVGGILFTAIFSHLQSQRACKNRLHTADAIVYFMLINNSSPLLPFLQHGVNKVRARGQLEHKQCSLQQLR